MAHIYFESIEPQLTATGRKPEIAIRGAADWWKDLNEYHPNHKAMGPTKYQSATIKACPAINDAINFGYTMFTQFDIMIDASDPDNMAWTMPLRGEVSSLLFENNYAFMVDGYKVPEGYHKVSLKISVGWSVRTDPGYSCWFTKPMHRHDLPFVITDAIIDTDTFPSYFPYTVFIKEGFNGVIKAGTPLLQAIPFKRETWEASYGEVNHDDIATKRREISAHFSGAYKKRFWSRKRFT